MFGYISGDKFDLCLFSEAEGVYSSLFSRSDGDLDILIDGDGGSTGELMRSFRGQVLCGV